MGEGEGKPETPDTQAIRLGCVLVSWGEGGEHPNVGVVVSEVA